MSPEPKTVMFLMFVGAMAEDEVENKAE